jgi:hypothetical protein
MSSAGNREDNNIVSVNEPTTHDVSHFVRRANRKKRRSTINRRRHNGFDVKERLKHKLAGKKQDYPAEECVEEVFKAYRDHFGHDIMSPDNVGAVPAIGDKQHLFWLQLEKQQQDIIQSQTNPLTVEAKKAMTKLVFIQNILTNWTKFEKLL